MLEEIRRYNNIGDVNGITYFLKLVLSDSRIQKSSAQKLCALRNNMRLNFPAAVSFAKYLGVVEEKFGYLYITEAGQKLSTSEKIEVDFCKLCFKRIISDDLLDMTAVHYNMNTNEYAIGKYGFAVPVALIRNILLQYHALKESSGDLIIKPEYESIFTEFQKKNKVGKSLEKLKKQLKEQEIQGERAEEFVMAFESKRLAVHPKVESIRRISIIDVSAGFDIISYDTEISEKYDRFIEVKSYLGNPHFYWSENEIETAKLYGERYFIYFIDVSKVDDPLYEPRIICNPAANVLYNESWIMNPTSYMVIPTD